MELLQLEHNQVLAGLDGKPGACRHDSDALAIGSHSFEPGDEYPAHYHETYEEIVVVIRGRLAVEIEGRILHLDTGEKTVISRRAVHRVFNDERQPAEIVFLKIPFDEQDTIWV